MIRQGLMRCIEIAAPGGPDVLHLVERPAPVPKAGEVLVRVEAAGVNRPDIMQRLGKYPPPPGASDVPGLEIAGTIIDAAPGVARWREGDRVCGLVAGGGYADLCAAPAPQCLPIPSGMSAAAAAAIPETYFTVWVNLFQRGALRHGERVLVHGGTSGIGTTAIQLARAFGASVWATAGSPEKCAACERLGARAINYRTTDFVRAILDATDGAGVHAILDIVGGDYLQRNLDCLAMDGRLIQIGLQGGAHTRIDLGSIVRRRATLTGSTLRPRSVEDKGAIARDLEERVWPLLAAQTVGPIVHAIFPLAEAADAHRLLESGDVIGKVVLTTDMVG
jgi:NADPH2:quinone reductase